MFARVSDDPEAIKEAAKVAAAAGYLQGIQENIGTGVPSPELTQDKVPDNLEAERDNIKNRTALTILELASHTLILVLVLFSLWLIHLVLETLFGKDARFFSFAPISWIIDLADLLVIGKFLWGIIQDFQNRR